MFEAFAGATAAVRDCVAPGLSVAEAGVTVTEETFISDGGTAPPVTVMAQVANAPLPSAAVAVITVCPFASAVTSPSCVTEAAAGLPEVQIKDWLEACRGSTLLLI